MPPSNCPSRDVLLAFKEGRVSDAVIEEITEHLSNGCVACDAVLAELDEQEDFLRELLRRHPFPGCTGESSDRKPVQWATNQINALPRVGEEVSGYEIVEVLGFGGMGIVYKARHPSIQPVVALKMILTGQHADARAVERFAVEGQAVARLRHANIVQVYAVGEHKGTPFLALEFVEGGNLASKLDGTPLPPREAARTVEALAYGVQHAHECGIVHRDLKPANVLLTRDGTPKITDFGLAKQVEGSHGLTCSDAIMGTPSYMAPEQAHGSANEIGPLTDVYALGAILYECLTGRPPFKAATPVDTVLQVRKDDPVPARRLQPAVPRDLETICHHCLEKNPTKRYGSAQELAEDLRRFQEGRPIKARPVGALSRVWRWSRRHPLAVILILTMLVGMAVCGVLWYQAVQSGREAKIARREAEEDFFRTRRLLTDLVAASNGPWQEAAGRRRARRAVLERAATLYDELCRARPTDRGLHGEFADVLTALAEAALAEEHYEAARDYASHAHALWTCLADEGPSELRWRIRHADALANLATAQEGLGHSAEMLDAFRAALAAYERLAEEAPEDVERLLAVVTAREKLSLQLFYQDRTGERRSLLEKSRQYLTAYLNRGRDSALVRLALVKTLYWLGQSYEWPRDRGAAIRCWQEGYRWSVGLTVVLPKNPSAWFYSTQCARCLPATEPGALQPAEVLAGLEQAVRHQETNLVLTPDDPETAAFLVQLTSHLAECYFDAGHPVDALRVQRRAAEVRPARPANSPILEMDRLAVIALLARREEQVGQHDAARGHAREVADGFGAFCRMHRKEPALLWVAAFYCSQLAPPLRHAGATDQSRRVVECALQLAQELVRAKSDTAHLRWLDSAWVQLAKCCMRDNPGGVEAALTEAVVVSRRLAFLDRENRSLLDDRLRRLARHLGANGKRREAAGCLHECERLWPDSANDLRGLARGFRELADELRPGQTDLAPAEKDERQSYLAEGARLEKAADALQRQRE